jgi:hypothetical protein
VEARLREAAGALHASGERQCEWQAKNNKDNNFYCCSLFHKRRTAIKKEDMTKKIGMKEVTLILMIIITLAGCGQSNKKTEIIEIDPEVVNVFYFHGKQRCKTCVAVQDVARETIEKAFADNDKVRFIEINTSEKEFEALCEKYEVTWNALIISKGEEFIEITDQAFATAVGNPQSLVDLIKEEVNKRLSN